MSRLVKASCAAVLILAIHNACVPNDGGGGGGGPQGRFSTGFIFVKRDDRNVYLIDRADYSRNITTNLFKLTTQGGYSQPSLSKDGTKAVFVHTNADGTTEIEALVISAAGAAPTRLLAEDALHRGLRHPVFSPDGNTVVFAYDGMGGASFLGRMDADGRNFLQLTSGVRSYSAPSFYPGGQEVLAIAGDTNTRYNTLERVNLNNPTNPTVVTNMLGGADSVANRAVVAPDGSKAAFDGRLSGTGTRIFVLIFGGSITQTTDHPSQPSSNDTFPTWVGSDQVGFSSDFGGGDGIYIRNANANRDSGGLTVPSAIEPYFGPN